MRSPVQVAVLQSPLSRGIDSNELLRDEWVLFAYCRREDPELFYGAGESQKYAANLCIKHCPVIVECRTEAFDRKEAHGVWGGTTERERQKIFNQRTPRML